MRGYPSSFIEEAFGGLVREGLEIENLKSQLEIRYVSDVYIGYRESIIEAIENAGSNDEPA